MHGTGPRWYDVAQKASLLPDEPETPHIISPERLRESLRLEQSIFAGEQIMLRIQGHRLQTHKHEWLLPVLFRS